MHQTHPLPDTHPEFSVVHWPGFTEYRIENWRLARDGSGRVVRRTSVLCWVDVGVLVIVVVILSGLVEISASRRDVLFAGIGITLAYLLWTRFTQVLYESILVFPTIGIQLETHHGHPLLPFPIPMFTTHHFIPLSALEDIVLHEGFRRWDVRFYLAVLRRRWTRSPAPAIPSVVLRDNVSSDRGSGRIEVRVAFENILPYFPVLKEVYLGVQEALFLPPARIVETVDVNPIHES